MKRALLALATVAFAACGGLPSEPAPGSVWVGKADGEAFGGIMTLLNGQAQDLYVECPFGELCGVNINDWWLSGLEVPAEDPQGRYGIGVTARAEAPDGPKESSSFAGLGDIGTFAVFRGAAKLSFEPQGWLPPNGIDIQLEFPSCGWVTWCPSFKRAFGR